MNVELELRNQIKNCDNPFGLQINAFTNEKPCRNSIQSETYNPIDRNCGLLRSAKS